MSGILKGLDAINARIAADEARQSGGDFVKAEFFKLADKQFEEVVFLQELDADSENFSEKNGLGIVAIEHSNPNNFKRKALCTLEDEGSCWACEQHRLDYKAGWKQKVRLYINALVLPKGEAEEKVVVISQGLSDSQISPALFEQAGTFGTITVNSYKIKRSGSGFNDTSYLLTALKPHDKKVEDYEVFDLEKVVRQVPYDQQAAHYLDTVSSSGDDAKEPALVGAGNVGSEPAAADDDTW